MSVGFTPANAADIEALADLRVASMRESLERVGRFDPVRARERLRKSFVPEATEWIEWEGRRVGFLALREEAGRFSLDHLYILPEAQRRGIGSTVVVRLKERARARGLSIAVGALRGSASNAFYRKHGFTCVSEEESDLRYLWEPSLGL